MISVFSHLIDDGTAGGVNRMLSYMESCPELAARSSHKIVPVRRGQLSAPSLKADAIVSNLVVSWANFPLFAALRAAYPRTPLIHIEHSYSERFVALHVENRDRFETLVRSVYGMFDHIVAVSDPQAAWLSRKDFVHAPRLRVIEPLADLAPFLALPDPAPGAKRIVGAVGRLAPQKGLDNLIKGFRAANPKTLELHLYGEGPQRDELVALAQDDPNIVFKGFASHPAAAMAACDILVMPSRWEPYGMVAIEAAAAGRQLICSRADGLLSHIRAGAIDVGENAPEGWTARMRELDESQTWPVATRGRDRARMASRRFIEGWGELISEVSPRPEAVAPAA